MVLALTDGPLVNLINTPTADNSNVKLLDMELIMVGFIHHNTLSITTLHIVVSILTFIMVSLNLLPLIPIIVCAICL